MSLNIKHGYEKFMKLKKFYRRLIYVATTLGTLSVFTPYLEPVYDFIVEIKDNQVHYRESTDRNTMELERVDSLLTIGLKRESEMDSLVKVYDQNEKYQHEILALLYSEMQTWYYGDVAFKVDSHGSAWYLSKVDGMIHEAHYSGRLGKYYYYSSDGEKIPCD